MIDETYFKFFPRELESIDLIITKLSDNENGGEDLQECANIEMRLKEVELREIIRSVKKKYVVQDFIFFLNDLLSELFAAIEFHNDHQNVDLNERQRVVMQVLRNFNIKVLAGLNNSYFNLSPSSFGRSETFNSTQVGFIVDSKKEKTDPFRLAFLIASGKITFDQYNFFYEDELYTSANSLAQKIDVNRIYLSHTKNFESGFDNKNIFSPGRQNLHSYILSKMKSLRLEPSNFYLDLYHKIGR